VAKIGAVDIEIQPELMGFLISPIRNKVTDNYSNNLKLLGFPKIPGVLHILREWERIYPPTALSLITSRYQLALALGVRLRAGSSKSTWTMPKRRE
jgi:hypothetical protein